MTTDYCFTCGTYTSIDDISYMCESCEKASLADFITSARRARLTLCEVR